MAKVVANTKVYGITIGQELEYDDDPSVVVTLLNDRHIQSNEDPHRSQLWLSALMASIIPSKASYGSPATAKSWKTCVTV